VTNVQLLLQRLLAGGPLAHVRILDVGPSFGDAKRLMGLRPLPWGRTVRAAALS
jgi:hypothetical protein